jgi:hypothetical protein
MTNWSAIASVHAHVWNEQGHFDALSGMSKDQFFVERRPQGDYAVRRGGSERASDVLPTQSEAIDRARELNHGKAPLVERVRNTDVGRRDKWRKP